MEIPGHESLWTTVGPVAWPDSPAEMTVTTLFEIETCPRRWALGAARYPDLWTRRGYPPRVQLGALAGTVVHLVLEQITKRLVRDRCPSVHDPKAFQIMKELGGYTKVVNECIDRVLERLGESPRGRRLLEFADRSLRSRVGELRTRAQTMLSRVRLQQFSISHKDGQGSKLQGPLPSGAFSEIELRLRRIGWKGKADLLVLSPSLCEIIDFKTGDPDDAHRFQIQVYALLWSRDPDLNPDGRCVDRLVLAYANGDVEVATPTEAELNELESHLVSRSDAAYHAVSQHPPEARPHPEHCRYCGVRQLCTEYWTSETQRRLREQGDEQRFTDVEVTITGRHGPTSWEARVELARTVPAGKAAVVRTTGAGAFRPGDRLRFLDVATTIDPDDEAQPAMITVGTLSETYAVV